MRHSSKINCKSSARRIKTLVWFCIDLPIFFQIERSAMRYDVISFFQDGGHSVSSLYFRFTVWSCLAFRSKTLCLPNVDKLPQSRADILLLPVSLKNGRNGTPHTSASGGACFILRSPLDPIYDFGDGAIFNILAFWLEIICSVFTPSFRGIFGAYLPKWRHPSL